MTKDTKFEVGDWLDSDPASRASYVSKLSLEVAEKDASLHPVIKEFKKMIETDPQMYILTDAMISQVSHRHKYNPAGGHQIDNYDEMLTLLNAVLKKAPEFTGQDFIILPIHAILDWSMSTPAGFSAFINPKFNAILEKILNAWCDFLNSGESLYVLNDGEYGWMCKTAADRIRIQEFEHEPDKPHWGFTSWNNFFTRKFKPGARPIADPDDDSIIINACESKPYRISTNVKRFSNFWLKAQPYSLEFMLCGDESVKEFVGGTVYQAYLSAYNYHRWHSPINGTIKKAWVQKGTYFSEAPAEGLRADEMYVSQPYIPHVATRAILLIESSNPVIGLMAFVAVGMAEVSSCNVTVKEGQKVTKGDEIGFFQFGGSTHCLVFRPDVISQFSVQALPQPESHLVLVNSEIAIANK